MPSDSVTRAREDLCGVDSHPVSVSSKHVERKERRDLLTKPTKHPNQKKRRLERGDLLNSDIPEQLQEFRENLVADRVPERTDSHASSSHEVSLEPKAARSVDLGKHSVYTHFLKDRNCRGPKLQGHRAEDVMEEPYLVQKIWWLDNSRSQSSHWRLWISKQSSLCSRRAGLGHPMDPVVSVQKQKLLRQHKGACKSSWSRIGSLKSFTLTIPWNLAKLVKIFPGVIVRRHHTDRKQMGLLREQCAEWKKVPLQYCCNQVWMAIGGQILWNVIPICETFKISCLMGKLHTKAVLENHLKDQWFRLVHWLSITLFLRNTSQESISLERMSYLDCSLDTPCTQGEFWKGDILVADIGNDGRIRNLI